MRMVISPSPKRRCRQWLRIEPLGRAAQRRQLTFTGLDVRATEHAELGSRNTHGRRTQKVAAILVDFFGHLSSSNRIQVVVVAYGVGSQAQVVRVCIRRQRFVSDGHALLL